MKGGAPAPCAPPLDPPLLSYTPGSQRYSEIYGTENEYPITGRNEYNVPCAVCFASIRVAVLMIPARTSCPTGWTMEYYGYLTSTHQGDNHHRTSFECVDKDQDSVRGSGPDTHGAVFYHVAMALRALHITTTKN